MIWITHLVRRNMASKYKKELDEMTWSFSRLHMWEQCHYAFYLKYIEQATGIDNYWAANGKAVHETLEKFFKGEIPLSEICEHYIDLYDEICEETKQSTMDKCFEECANFFSEYDFSFIDKYEILGVEKKCDFKIGKYKFTGYIDLLLRDKESGEIVVFDHKSSQFPFKKNGIGVLKNCEDNFESYKHQMYLYCKQVIDEYGVQPSKIAWLHFRDQKLATIDFNIDEYNESLKWATDTIKSIYKDSEFEATDSFMLCGRLCDFRDGDCEYKELRKLEDE